MSVRVHYGSQSYIAKEQDSAALARQAFEILTSGPQMSGIWNLETTSGQVYLLLTRNTPVAVEDFDDALDYHHNSLDFSDVPGRSVSRPDA
ncbi:hypothetical protein [Naasia sp. SYSU D00948]|uniref:hypothetical protein n=1 Tax=Naasia sp. SYSU D00948 TaxID=2817379 RepID=UPI001B30773B|nr:hypothetical protein [Naasia sp. SYSU D00948]